MVFSRFGGPRWYWPIIGASYPAISWRVVQYDCPNTGNPGQMTRESADSSSESAISNKIYIDLGSFVTIGPIYLSSFVAARIASTTPYTEIR
jgi:hypothetical protein